MRNVTLFHQSCKRGDLARAQELFDKITLTVNDEWYTTFRVVCTQLGNVEMSRWLYGLFPGKIDLSMQQEFLFRHACGEGHLTMAQWILSHHPTCRIRSCGDHALRMAAHNGHLSVIQWLFSLDPTVDLAMGEDELLQGACMRHQVDMVNWILQHRSAVNRKRPFLLLCQYGFLDHVRTYLCPSDLAFYRWEGFLLACTHGHLSVVEYLYHSTFTTMDLIPCVMNTCRQGQFPIVTWLCGRIEILHVLPLFQVSCLSDQWAIAQWLHDRYSVFDCFPTTDALVEWVVDLCVEVCLLNYVNTAQWLLTFHQDIYLELPVGEIMIELSYREEGYTLMMDFLYSKYPHFDLRVSEDLLFGNACWAGNDTLAKWIIDHIPEKTSANHRLFQLCRQRGRYRVAQYLSECCPMQYEVVIDPTLQLVSYTILTEIQQPSSPLQLPSLSSSSIPVEDPCVICYEPATLLTNCAHPYCQSCLQKCIQSHPTCAYCRQLITHTM